MAQPTFYTVELVRACAGVCTYIEQQPHSFSGLGENPQDFADTTRCMGYAHFAIVIAEQRAWISNWWCMRWHMRIARHYT